jgi:hypothetical protein
MGSDCPDSESGSKDVNSRCTAGPFISAGTRQPRTEGDEHSGVDEREIPNFRLMALRPQKLQRIAELVPVVLEDLLYRKLEQSRQLKGQR